MKIPAIAIALATSILTACGGGGSDNTSASSTTNYSKWNGRYACTAIIDAHIVDHAQLVFSSTGLQVTELDSGRNQVVTVNDFIGTLNGYPMYTEKVSGSATDSVGFLFSVDEILPQGG